MAPGNRANEAVLEWNFAVLSHIADSSDRLKRRRRLRPLDRGVRIHWMCATPSHLVVESISDNTLDESADIPCKIHPTPVVVLDDSSVRLLSKWTRRAE